ncbi:hypothetical protein M413DRAFT_240101 [Hebeloma cylindrosporum]|uniref:Uncharacterized protein n=1 Tax=Hebeloma cylindrosporum TaxID=76867 RepID=A0A0C3C4Y9_HEBCY|nr:hypothetical protein M413DRAFT_240101 [Hebeloma cylindrosporum h7]
MIGMTTMVEPLVFSSAVSEKLMVGFMFGFHHTFRYWGERTRSLDVLSISAITSRYTAGHCPCCRWHLAFHICVASLRPGP